MKKRTTRVLAILICLLMVAALFTGCSSGSSTKKAHVDVFYYNYADAYISTVRDAMNARLDALGVDYTNYDGKGDQATQTNDINTALSKGTSLLIVNIVDNASADTANSIVTAAAAKGVPVVFFNREPSAASVFSTAGDPNAASVAFVGTNYVQAGYLQGQLIYNTLTDPNNLNTDGSSKFDVNNDGQISYAMFRGQMDNNEAIARTLYSVLTANMLLKAGGYSFSLVPSDLNVTTNDTSTSTPPTGWDYNYNGTQMDLATAISQNGFNPLEYYSVDKDSNWSSANANAMISTMYATDANAFTDGKIEFIICNNDDMAMGVISFLNTVNFNMGNGNAGGFIPIIGVDATSTARDKITSGAMTGSIEQSNVAMAQMVITVAMNALAKDTLTDIGTIPLTVDGVNNNMLRIPYGIVTD